MSLPRSVRFASAVLALTLCTSTAATAADEPPGNSPATASEGSTVTLLTGDRVTTHGGKNTVQPGPGRENIHFATYRHGGHLYVIPSDAASLVAEGSVDRRLFDVTTLLESGYGDAATSGLPLIVTQGAGQTFTAPNGTSVTQALPSINGSGLNATKSELDGLWNSVTAEAEGNRVLSGGVNRIWLDGMRSANLDRSAGQIGAPQAWQSGVTGKGATVAVLDTGVDQTHPDLKDREGGQRNFSDAKDNVDHFGHGTHVAGTVAGTGAFSNGKYRGIAHGAKVLDGKVLNNSGSGRESWIIAGMQWAAEQEADIANLSLGGSDAPAIDPLEKAVNSLSANSDTLFVIAAGNSGPSAETVGSPGSADAALTVGAVNRQDGLAQFSSRGPRIGDGAIKPDITAPGTDIVSALHSDATIGEPIDGRYTALSGTSMATPHVAGAAALVAQAHPNLTGEQLKSVLTSSAKPNPELTAFEQGSGRVNVPAALAQPVTSQPTNVSFGTQLWPHGDDKPVTKELTYHNAGKRDLTLDVSVSAKGPGGQPAPKELFTVDKPHVTVPAGGSAKVKVTGDTRLDTPDGVYSGDVVASSGETRISTPVAVTKEVESYDLTIRYQGGDGKPTSKASTMAFSSDLASTEFLPGGKPTSEIRLPKGQYTLQSSLYTGGQQNPHSSLLLRPNVDLSKDVALDFDFSATKPVSITPPDKAATPRMGLAGFQFFSGGTSLSFDMVSARPDQVSTAHLGPELPPDQLVSHFSGVWSGKDGDYNLAFFEPGKLPTGFRRDVGREEMATVRHQFGSPVPNRSGSIVNFGSDADSGSPINLGTSIDTPLPGSRTSFYNAEGVRWSSMLTQAKGNRAEALFQSPPRIYQPGKRHHVRHNFAPFAPAFPAQNTGAIGWANRLKDSIATTLPLWSDGEGNGGFSNTAKGRTTLHRDEELIGESNQPGQGMFSVPAEPARYRLSTEANQPPGTVLSPHMSATWTFESGHTDGVEPLPLSVVRFQPELADDNSAPAGKHQDVPVFLQGMNGQPIPHQELSVQVSYDGGKTWADAPVSGEGTIGLDYPADAKSVSLRASGSDQRDNTVEQTVIAAYKLKR